jgi:hypothetical protein
MAPGLILVLVKLSSSNAAKLSLIFFSQTHEKTHKPLFIKVKKTA